MKLFKKALRLIRKIGIIFSWLSDSVGNFPFEKWEEINEQARKDAESTLQQLPLEVVKEATNTENVNNN